MFCPSFCLENKQIPFKKKIHCRIIYMCFSIFKFFFHLMFLWDDIIVGRIVSEFYLEGRSTEERQPWWGRGEERPTRWRRNRVINATPSHDHHACSEIINLRYTFFLLFLLLLSLLFSPSLSFPPPSPLSSFSSSSPFSPPSSLSLCLSLSLIKKSRLSSGCRDAEWNRTCQERSWQDMSM